MRRPAALILLLVAVGACGASRQQVLRESMHALDAASAALLRFSELKEAAYLEEATSPEDKGKALEFRKKVDTVATSLKLAYAAAATALALDDGQVDVAISLALEALRAFRALVKGGP